MAKSTTQTKSAGKTKSSRESTVDTKRFPKITKRRRQLPKGPRGGMRLVLTENVPHLGKQGDMVEVKPGYGRNYLLPQGLATYVTPDILKRIEKYQAKLEALRIARVNELKMLAKEIEKHSLTIEANATEEGHLYGSVTVADVVRAFAADKLRIDPETIKLEGTIKELGLYHVPINLGEEVTTEVKLWVVPTGGKSGAES